MEHSSLLFSGWFLVYLSIAWLIASIAAGAVFAFLAKRIHKTISFKKNWLFFSTLMAAIGMAVLGLGIR